MKIAIAGAGVAGLAVGWRLAQSGADVQILERGRAGRGATWAAAGMLAPGAEFGGEAGTLADFARAARAAWPDFAAEIERESGCVLGYRQKGSLLPASDAARAEALRGRPPEDAQWLDTKDLRAREPLLSPELFGALYWPGDAQVDNRVLGEALSRLLARSNASLREDCEVRSIVIEDNRLRAIVTSQGAIACDAAVVASGAWLNGLNGEGAAVLPPVMPAKGQMIALEPPAGDALPNALLWSEDIYLVPRGGRMLAGATVEDAGFDTSVTREACARLHAAASRLIPAARQWRIAEAWAGLRPRSPDGLPVLGETAVSGLFVAGGQFRNGILFAPLVADIMRRIVLGEDNPIPAFDPKRFRTSAAA